MVRAFCLILSLAMFMSIFARGAHISGSNSPGLRSVASLIKYTKANIDHAAALLNRGHLVAFPTETVYGLGAHALQPLALQRIFEIKRRPLNDPLIVHVKDFAVAETLVSFPQHDTTNAPYRIYKALAREFWPGPLTIVYRAKSNIPELVTAQTGFIGVRSPSHRIARMLLEAANAPIAAPSANRFGHVSPTTAQHVMADLGDAVDLTIIDGGESCEIGIESTVCKIDEGNQCVHILRAGAITRTMIELVLRNEGIFDWSVALGTKAYTPNAGKSHREIGARSPGNFIRHYSPDVPTLLIHPSDIPSLLATNHTIDRNELLDIGVVDFGGKLHNLSNNVRCYVDLSKHGDIQQASRVLFSTLRWMETQQLSKILLIDLNSDTEHNETLGALADRMTKAASGQHIQ